MSATTQDLPDTRRRTDIISDELRQIFTLVNGTFLCGIIGIFGIITNIVNMVVFYKQGLNTTINISFFAMALSDMWSLIFQMWFIICDIPSFEDLNLPVAYSDVQYILGGIPRELFARITCLITAYVTAERCMCIIFPLHIKQMITPKRTTIIVIVIFLVTWTYISPLFIVYNLHWQFNPNFNRSILKFVMSIKKDEVEGTIFLIHAVFGVLSQVAVVTFTLILIRKLGQTHAWRKSVKVNQENSELMSKRDRATITMVVLIASILIICYLPAVCICVGRFCEPEYAEGGDYLNFYLISWSIALVFETINSSVNIFFYYKMSSRFRQIFREIFQIIADKNCGLQSNLHNA